MPKATLLVPLPGAVSALGQEDPGELEELHFLESQTQTLSSETELLVLSRYPRLGRVKTRLSSVLTPKTCLELHNALLLDTVDRILLLRADVHLFLADCSLEDMAMFAHTMRIPANVRVHRQEGRDLGQRMWNAYRKVSRRSKRAVFLGSDTPSLPLDYVQQAVTQLDRFPVVMGPADDGGYYLLAISQAMGSLFEDIDWGTEAVLEQTRSRLKEGEYWLLPRWYDIDRGPDLEKLRQDLEQDFQGFPRRTKRLLARLQESRS